MLSQEVGELYTDTQVNFAFKTHYLEEFLEGRNTTEIELGTSVNNEMDDKMN